MIYFVLDLVFHVSVSLYGTFNRNATKCAVTAIRAKIRKELSYDQCVMLC